MTLTIESPLFVYGTLLSLRVQASLLGRIPRSDSAMVKGWEVRRVYDRPYPSISQSNNLESIVIGMVLWGLSYEERCILHMYEGESYRVVELDVSILGSDDEQLCTAWCYILRDNGPDRVDCTMVWDLESWMDCGAIDEALAECDKCRIAYLESKRQSPYTK